MQVYKEKGKVACRGIRCGKVAEREKLPVMLRVNVKQYRFCSLGCLRTWVDTFDEAERGYTYQNKKNRQNKRNMKKNRKQ